MGLFGAQAKGIWWISSGLAPYPWTTAVGDVFVASALWKGERVPVRWTVEVVSRPSKFATLASGQLPTGAVVGVAPSALARR